jgi:D-alanyl-D-alanine carboxypeptidase/D-alanyl-D-alanine-endopeptidase (penicillin-binding protein 4)
MKAPAGVVTRPAPRPRRQRPGRAAVAIAVALALASFGLPTAADAGTTASGAAKVVKAIDRIEHEPIYRQSDWGYTIMEQGSGRVLASQNAAKMFDPGSTMKSYSVSTALRMYGPNYRFHTPVYRVGPVTGGTLEGNLVLVGKGDLTFGLRERPDGTLYYENLPAVDQSYADELPGAVEPPGNPMTALDELAADVRGAGITRISGNVVIDDRLFRAYDGFPDGLMTPIWVNENLVDLLVKPGAVGKPASIDVRPATSAYTVEDEVTTAAAGRATNLNVSEPTPGTIAVTGQIAAGSPPTLKVWEVADPAAFARTAFIEALARAGVTVAAPVTGPNPSGLLPTKGRYPRADLIGEHVSLPLSQYAKLILKVSYNRGADLMACLAAVKLGSKNCARGMAAEVDTATGLGIRRSEVIPFDGAGSDDEGRTTPTALATLLRRIPRTSYGPAFVNSLPILGRDGTLANVLDHSPVAGHAQIKTGNRVVNNAAGQINVLGNSLAGYVETSHGRHLVLMIVVGNVPIQTPEAFEGIVSQQAQMIEAVYQHL